MRGQHPLMGIKLSGDCRGVVGREGSRAEPGTPLAMPPQNGCHLLEPPHSAQITVPHDSYTVLFSDFLPKNYYPSRLLTSDQVRAELFLQFLVVLLLLFCYYFCVMLFAASLTVVFAERSFGCEAFNRGVHSSLIFSVRCTPITSCLLLIVFFLFEYIILSCVHIDYKVLSARVVPGQRTCCQRCQPCATGLVLQWGLHYGWSSLEHSRRAGWETSWWMCDPSEEVAVRLVQWE